MNRVSFYSKILLFGEYGIIKNSKGLAIPYNSYNGTLKIPADRKALSLKEENSNTVLQKFSEFLVQLCSKHTNISFDFERLHQDIEQGMFFDSSIPQGYGVGSSGAVVAAIYDKYAHNKISATNNLSREKLLSLKTIFSQMENFFHGTSSGLDPLNSYLSLPILIKSHDHIEPTGIPAEKKGKGAVFLIDSGAIGETSSMVQVFMDSMKNEHFQQMIKDEFVTYTNHCIDDFLNANFKSLFKNVKKLSKLVLANFKPMIPENFHKLWEKGINSGDYFLKLCGSGGGGYILGFTQDFEKTQKLLKDYHIEVVYQF